jgi:hypothetical protein
MNGQELEPYPVMRATLGEDLMIPQPCTHDEELVVRCRPTLSRIQRKGYKQCQLCGQHLPDKSALRARDFPGLIHAVVFFGISWIVYLLIPKGEMRPEASMTVAWLACFVISYSLRTPLSSARNAWGILFTLSWLLFYALHGKYVTTSYLLTHTIQKWLECFFAVTPIFASRVIRALIDLLRRQA